ncbi:hypothetical protein O7626_02545 [Micromonospora sp. WMMD1102]|uniref:TolB family protein n=1 Tax=Micromonospora sp. WMMD1102 TaxID=3016105 RepID=UPI0024152E6B|nr:hypothetical protein [Micromonospora sp. WMMD1102]MDG4784821.1 hypothetical protein [Micromonospora sp. WMMD1102]
MDERVRGVLTAYADEMAPVRLPDDLWRRGRRRRRVRLATAAGVATVLLAGAVLSPSLLAGSSSGTVGDGSATADPAIPGRVEVPWLWQATARQWAPGPATVMFFTGATRYFEDTGVVVGRGGAYRLVYLDVGESRGVLSPDGRYYARFGPALLDLATGDERQLGRASGSGSDSRSSSASGRGLTPLAWSPDGRWLVCGRNNDDEGISYGPDGQQLNDPDHPDDLVAVDTTTGEFRDLVKGGQLAYGAAAYSPDGASVAVASQHAVDGEQRLAVLDAATGRERWSLDLGHRQLGGTGAWSPDGRRLAILAVDGCTSFCDESGLAAQRWRIEFLDAGTGASAGAPIALPGRPGEVLGWRAGVEPVLSYTPAAEMTSRRTVLVAVNRNSELELLVDAADEVTGMAVPRQLVEAGRFGGPSPGPSPFAAQWWALLAVGLVLAPMLGWLVRCCRRLVGRRRIRRRAAPG